jgi:hydrogenase-4 membrane subunit HyfE
VVSGVCLDSAECSHKRFLVAGLNVVASGRHVLRQGLGYTLAGKASVCVCVFLELYLFHRAEVVCRAGLAAACAETNSL